MPVLTDEKYYRTVPRESMAEQASCRRQRPRFPRLSARGYNHRPRTTFYTSSISDVVNAGANFLERSYPHRATSLLVNSVRALNFSAFRRQVCRIEPNVLSVRRGSFGVATSNAVLEHVGSWLNQYFFVSELCRVAARVFSAFKPAIPDGASPRPSNCPLRGWSI